MRLGDSVEFDMAGARAHLFVFVRAGNLWNLIRLPCLCSCHSIFHSARATAYNRMSTQDIEIRNAVSDDLDQIAAIWRHYVRETIVNLEETPPNTENVRKNLSPIIESNFPFIVAIEDTTICGYAYIGPFNARSGYRFCCEDSIYLAPNYTGKGLGKRLLETLLRLLKADTSVTQVMAKISLDPEAELSEIPSCRLHQSFGFKEAGRLTSVGFKFGRWLDVVMLQLDLTEPARSGV